MIVTTELSMSGSGRTPGGNNGSNGNGNSGRVRAMTVDELAALVAGDVQGDGGMLILGVSSIEDAQQGDIVFAENQRFLSKAAKSRASAIVAFPDAVSPDKTLIRVENPRYAFAQILEQFKPNLNFTPGVHETAVLGHDVRLGANVSIGASATIGDNASIGDDVVIMPGCFVGDQCIIANGCTLYANVTLYDGCILGRNTVIHSGAVIGADGFGYMQIGERSYKVPQIGNVEIGEDVEIGANCTIDRAKTGSTVIGDRTKLDNLVHIAHNVKTGTDCIIVAQVGVAGSTTLGNRVIIAGQAGIKDHITIADDCVIMGQAGVFGDVEPGQVYSGYPARPHRDRMRIEGAVANLPDYVKRIRAMEKTNAALAESNERLQQMVAALAEKAGLDLHASEE